MRKQIFLLFSERVFQSVMSLYIGLLIAEHSILYSTFLVYVLKMKLKYFYVLLGRRGRTLSFATSATRKPTQYAKKREPRVICSN